MRGIRLAVDSIQNWPGGGIERHASGCIITLPSKLRSALQLKADDQLIAEITPEGLLLRPAVTLPIEMYTPARIREFDDSEADLAKLLTRQYLCKAPRRLFSRVVLWVAVACLIALTGFAMFQDRLLYFPEKTAVANVVSKWLGAWPAADELRGLVAMPTGPARGTVIVFHGNAGHVGHRAYYAAVLTEFGLRVILAEYPGYGPREGRLGEQSLVDDAEQTVDRAHRLYGTPLLLVGESLGAGVAAAAGSRQRDKIAGMILLTPWDRLMSVAAYHFPWLPVGWLLRDHYDSIAHLASFERSILVAVAEQDSIVPARFGMALYDSLVARKQLKVVRGAEHNDWRERVDLDWWREAVHFLLSTPAEQEAR